jgi:hypothetical protein
MSDQMNHQFETAPALCRQFDVELPAYLEGEDRPAVTIHARECGACGTLLAEINLIRSEARAVLLEDPPARLWANVRATLEAEGIFRESALSCRQFDLDLAAYLDGEARPELAKHARECSACGGILADLELIRSQAQTVLLEDPPARVWANVRATLEAEGLFRQPAKGWLGWFPQFGIMQYAAPLTALACLAIFGALLLVSPSPSGPAATENLAAVTSPPEQTVAAMETSYRAREKYLDPRVQASYQKGLQSLDKSIRECKDSVQREPANNLAREYLAAAYEQKVAVLSAALEYDGH